MPRIKRGAIGVFQMHAWCSAMIGYLILVHRFRDQFKRFQGHIRSPQQCEVMEGHAALWGGYSLVEAELRGMQHLLAMDRNGSRLINLNGHDFPLKTQPHIMAHLRAHPDREYIKVLDRKKVRPDTMRRIGKKNFSISIVFLSWQLNGSAPGSKNDAVRRASNALQGAWNVKRLDWLRVALVGQRGSYECIVTRYLRRVGARAGSAR